ncbi:SIR2 family protein [Promicromonospora panici]|uniref:SIR2 family protein n=1 Tax=Promicromonospora panici TaxID=2219658 RepID=UPI00101DF78D|nr:SIR2 family protein [Promicromonospora panici]
MSDGTLWITPEVGLPYSVLDAQAEGRLVFFVGAGASVAAPSNLPLFGELARQLSKLAWVPYEESVAIDYFLGAMPDNFDTHARTHDIISRVESRPNSTHTALVRLASSMGPIRIVTTNFDDHLASAALSEKIDIADRWIGPALPLGEDFQGLVHLHGSVLRSPRELVLTDSDFGRAYLTSAWATRFLLPMFQKFTVVFIGYSHDDPIMRYLALGLPSGTPRYAFTSSEGAADPKWRRLGVQPVGYPVDGHDHSALVRALEAWNDRARMGQLDHRARIQEIVSAGTALTPVDRDYLNTRLGAVEGAQEFARASSGLADDRKLEWLHWFEASPAFKLLFATPEVPDNISVLGDWFSHNFIDSPGLHGAALQTVQRLGQSMAGSLFRSAAWSTENLAKKDGAAAERWRAFLATSVHGHSAPLSAEYVLPYLPGAEPRSTSVLRSVLRPFLVLKRRWFVNEPEVTTAIPDADVTWNAEEHALTQHVLLAVQTAAPGDRRLGGALEEALAGAYDLLDTYHGVRAWDPLAFGRSAIEPHEQDAMRDPIDAIIDGLREFGAKAQEIDTDLPNRWWALDRPLFRRLALHLVAVDPTLTSEARLQWLLDRTGLYADDLKHEMYQVLAVSLADAPDVLRSQLLEAVVVGPEYPDGLADRERHVAYAKYNLLVWLTRSAPDWEAAETALAVIQGANPSFAPRDHPDFDRWMSSGTWGGKSPMEPEAFVQSLESDPATALGKLLSGDYSERSLGEPTWRDAVELVERSISERPDLGECLWAEADVLGIDGKIGDVRRAIVQGWSKADLGECALAAVTHVGTLVADAESATVIGRFLMAQVRRQIDSDETPALAEMREVSRALWREQSPGFTRSEDADPLTFAPLYLNSWPGDLAQYWISEVDRRWRQHRDDWAGLNELERDALVDLLRGSRAALDATQPALASALFFLFAADAPFTEEHILPIFRADSTAVFGWYPYLHHPRYNDKLLAAGLLDSVIEEWGRLEALRERGLQVNFFGLVASIVSFAGIASEDRKTLLAQSVLANSGAHAPDFAVAVVRFLSQDGIDGAKVWTHWLRDHLIDRLNGVPRTADSEELARWSDVVPHLGGEIPEAIALLGARGIGLGVRFFSSDFPESALSDHGSALAAYYAERVRNSAPANGMASYRVRRLIDSIRAGVDDEAVQPLIVAATEKGFLGSDFL